MTPNPTPDQLREQIRNATADRAHGRIASGLPVDEYVYLDAAMDVVAPVLEAQRQEAQAATEVLDRVREALRQPEDSALSMHAARVMAELADARASFARLRAVVTSALAELRRGGQTNDDRRRAADEILAAVSDSGRGSVPEPDEVSHIELTEFLDRQGMGVWPGDLAESLRHEYTITRRGSVPATPPSHEDTAQYEDGSEHFIGHQPRECGEHRTTGNRAWCFDCTEWCYPHAPCVRCEIPGLRPASSETTETKDQ